MESSARALEQQIDALRRKNSTTETILKNITQERDSAVSQLVVAYGTVEQLKCENETLKGENSELKALIVHMSHDREDRAQEQGSEKDQRRRKLNEKAEPVNGVEGKSDVQDVTVSRKGETTSHRSQDYAESPVRHSKASGNKDANTMFDLSSRQHVKLARAESSSHKVQTDDHQGDSDSMYEASVRKAKDKRSMKSSHHPHDAQDGEASRDLTYLSFIDVSFARIPFDIKHY